MAPTAELYGKASLRRAGADPEKYKSPEEYAGQGDKRVVRDLMFSYLVSTKDAAGNDVLSPVDAPRGTELTIEQMGTVALEKGERLNSFYTTEQLKMLKQTGREAPSAAEAGGNLSELGPHELAEWIETEKPTINEVLEAVGEDKDLAHRMLEAENIATDGDARTGLTEGLRRVIEG